MMSEARKRAISPGPENTGPLQKKRNLSTSDESKAINGTADHDDEKVDIGTEDLEVGSQSPAEADSGDQYIYRSVCPDHQG